MKIHYNPKLKTLSRNLRKSGNLSEVLLWNAIKGRKIKALQFSRQKPINDFIVDFCCSKLKLVIEIDGTMHDNKEERDKARERKLESLGLAVLRFTDQDVRANLEGVVYAIEEWITKREEQPP